MNKSLGLVVCGKLLACHLQRDNVALLVFLNALQSENKPAVFEADCLARSKPSVALFDSLLKVVAVNVQRACQMDSRAPCEQVA